MSTKTGEAYTCQRVLAIPTRKTERKLITSLSPAEQEALLAAPDRSLWLGHRDHALLLLLLQTGLRVSEACDLRCEDVVLSMGAHVRCRGKGRKERCTPLTRSTVAVMRAWLRLRRGRPAEPAFPSRRGTKLSRDAVERLVSKCAKRASAACSTLRTKRVTPHVLRHTAAVTLLRAGNDRAVIALWLGHESIETTQMYLDADLSMKERALARTTPLRTAPGRFIPEDELLAFLNGL
jgi:site-specific recombinase XerD